jgi:hypothetical protein
VEGVCERKKQTIFQDNRVLMLQLSHPVTDSG